MERHMALPQPPGPYLFFLMLDKSLLSLCYMPGTVLRIYRDEHNRSDSCPSGVYSLPGEIDVNQIQLLQLG